MNNNIHATCVNIKSKGVLILGDSGAGKSDLALRLITMFSAVLVSDDRTDIQNISGNLIAQAPDILKGLLEVRGVGIIKMNYLKESTIDLIVKLTSGKTERFPEKEFYEIQGVHVPLFNLNPQELSAPSKVLAMLSLL